MPTRTQKAYAAVEDGKIPTVSYEGLLEISEDKNNLGSKYSNNIVEVTISWEEKE
jgi:hypothetical protein